MKRSTLKMIKTFLMNIGEVFYDNIRGKLLLESCSSSIVYHMLEYDNKNLYYMICCDMI